MRGRRIRGPVLGLLALSCGQSGGSGTTGSSAGSLGAASSGSTTAGQTSSGGATAGSSGTSATTGSGGFSNVGGSGGSGSSNSGGSVGSSTGAAGSATGTGGSGGGAGAAGDPEAPPELVWEQVDDLFACNGMWGSGPNDVYAVAQGGEIAHFDGATWSSMDSTTTAHLTGIWGSGPDDIRVSTYSNAMLRWDGSGEWHKTVLDSGWTFSDVWGATPTAVFATNGGLVRYDGDSWGSAESVGSTYGVERVTGNAEDDVWLVNPYGTITHYTAPGEWRVQYPADTLSARAELRLQDIEAAGPNAIYIVGYDTILFSEGDGNWVNQYPSPGDGDLLNQVWAHSETAVFAVSQRGFVFRSAGDGNWLKQKLVEDDDTGIGCIWGTGPDDIYVGQTWGIYHGTPK